MEKLKDGSPMKMCFVKFRETEVTLLDSQCTLKMKKSDDKISALSAS